MKRTIIFAVALASAFGVQAQSEKDLERAAFLRDSVKDVLAEHRANYAHNEDMREKLSPTILSLEKEMERLQQEYDKILARISQRDVKSALEAYDEARKSGSTEQKSQVVVEDKGNAYIPDKARMRRDLVANDYFAERLSATDFKSLRSLQQRESTVKECVELLHRKYSELLALQRQYMEAPTKPEADEFAQQFAAKQSEIASLDSQISSMWSSLYFNKIYAYDLLMERDGKTAMLDFSAEVAARAEREINSNSDLYQSDALVSYYVRKRALTEYEMGVAAALSLTTSRDSLSSVLSALQNRDYRLSKLSLQRRSFINYEDVEIKIPSIYTSKNPVPKTKVYDYGVIYRVRVGIFSKRPSVSAFRGATPLSYSDTTHSGYYTYYVGGFRTEQEAKDAVDKLKKAGFRDPLISVWVDGAYYPTVADMRRSESKYSLEITGVASLTDDMKSRILSQNSDCTISRVGSTFVVGPFVDKLVAEAVAADLRSVDSALNVEITKK